MPRGDLACCASFRALTYLSPPRPGSSMLQRSLSSNSTCRVQHTFVGCTRLRWSTPQSSCPPPLNVSSCPLSSSCHRECDAHITRSEPRRLTQAFLHCRCLKGKQKQHRDGFDYAIPASLSNGFLWGKEIIEAFRTLAPSRQRTCGLCFLTRETLCNWRGPRSNVDRDVCRPHTVGGVRAPPWRSFWNAGQKK